MAERPRITVVEGGPLVVDGVPLAWVVKGDGDPDGPPRWSADPIPEVGSRYALCRCDGSGSMPLCDRWPDRLPCFEEPAPDAVMPSFTWRAPDGVDGPLVALKRNGPARVWGGVPIERQDGSAIDDGERISLCRCGISNAMPYCDSTHKVVGFRDS